MNDTTTRNSAGRWLYRLVSCCWHLGARHGWRYWKIMRRADQNPEMLRIWAFQCRVEATDEEWRGNERMAFALRAWSDELEAHYAANSGDEPRAEGGGSNPKPL